MNRRGVTSETALLLGKVFGTTPEFWLNLQIISDLWATQHSEVMKGRLAKKWGQMKLMAAKSAAAPLHLDRTAALFRPRIVSL